MVLRQRYMGSILQVNSDARGMRCGLIRSIALPEERTRLTTN